MTSETDLNKRPVGKKIKPVFQDITGYDRLVCCILIGSIIIGVAACVAMIAAVCCGLGAR